jgi:hypothetical protein
VSSACRLCADIGHYPDSRPFTVPLVSAVGLETWTYMIVVAVPTKKSDAFPPGLVGWTLTALAGGSRVAAVAKRGRSLVGA